MKSLWNTTEPPHDGTPIVAIGRVIASDEFSTWVEPFVMEVKWMNLSGHEGWHTRDSMSVARTLDDSVLIDYWALFPPAEPHLIHEGECAKSYGGHPCTCEREA